MKKTFNLIDGTGYKSNSQKIRVMSEAWVDNEIFCPNCGSSISNYENNRPVADFYCVDCKEEYELKSSKNRLGSKIVDGAYKTMLSRLNSNNNPNLFFLQYHLKNFEVINFVVIPKHFFIPKIIEKRKPLKKSTKRAGWIGCNILTSEVPNSGRIFYIKNGKLESKRKVLDSWKKTLFLRNEKNDVAKGWLLETMKCIEKIEKKEFSLDELYSFEDRLRLKYPNNNFIKDKLRQQLQILRDKNYLEFVSPGCYRLSI